MSIKYGCEKLVLNGTLKYVIKDPEVRLPKLMNKINKFMRQPRMDT